MLAGIALFHYDVIPKKYAAMDAGKRCHKVGSSFAAQAGSKRTQLSHTCRFLLKHKFKFKLNVYFYLERFLYSSIR